MAVVRIRTIEGREPTSKPIPPGMRFRYNSEKYPAGSRWKPETLKARGDVRDDAIIVFRKIDYHMPALRRRSRAIFRNDQINAREIKNVVPQKTICGITVRRGRVDEYRWQESTTQS